MLSFALVFILSVLDPSWCSPAVNLSIERLARKHLLRKQ